MINIKEVSKTYKNNGNHISAIKDINLNIGNNEFVCIIGPSGCGKSTLLKTIGGLIELNEGQIIINNGSIKESLVKKEIGFVFQDPVLMRWRNVEENILLPLEIKKVPHNNLDYLVKLVKLNGFNKAYPSQLSGGMQQRAAIARALILDPSILLMDEPFADLDEITRDHLNIELSKIWDSKKTSLQNIIFVTHNITEAMFLADKVVVLSNRPGKIKKIIPINFKRPRKLDIKHDKDFIKIKKEIKRLIEE
jgi:NitT/TauT family transport system ATP-binding protein